MATYTFRVLHVETYEAIIDVEADDLNHAAEVLREEVDQDPIDSRRDTFDESYVECYLYSKDGDPWQRAGVNLIDTPPTDE